MSPAVLWESNARPVEPTLPIMQLNNWVTSLEAIYQITLSFLQRHKRLHTVTITTTCKHTLNSNNHQYFTDLSDKKFSLCLVRCAMVHLQLQQLQLKPHLTVMSQSMSTPRSTPLHHCSKMHFYKAHLHLSFKELWAKYALNGTFYGLKKIKREHVYHGSLESNWFLQL